MAMPANRSSAMKNLRSDLRLCKTRGAKFSQSRNLVPGDKKDHAIMNCFKLYVLGLECPGGWHSYGSRP